MDTNERNEHFQGYATLLYPELARLFLVLYSARVTGTEEQVKQVEKMIKDLLAQHACDLVYHAIEFLRYSPSIRPMQLTSTDTWVDIIPDLTQWPT